MSRFRSNRAILVLESPWELDETDANRTSVIPFVEGVGKLTGDTAVHYANFYDKSSFKKGLDCLCKGNLKSRIVYIAAHGERDRVSGAKLMDLLLALADKSRDFQIDGVVVGACFAGGNTAEIEACIEGSGLKWCVGYNAAINWLPASLVDCSIMAAMSRLRSDVFKSRDRLVSKLAESLALFDPNTTIGKSLRGKNVSLRNTLTVVVQPVGQGFRAKDVSEEIWSLRQSQSLA